MRVSLLQLLVSPDDLLIDTTNAESCEEPAGEKRFLSSSASKLITEESPNEMVVFGSSCITSGPEKGNSTGISATGEPNGSQNETVNCVSPSSLSIVPSEVSPVLKSPTPSVSPRISSSRKSLRTSSMLTASQKDSKNESKPGPENMRISFAKSNSSAALTAQTSKSCLAPTEHLAASLHRGLEIIDSHRKSSVFRRLSFRFASKPGGSNPILPVNVGVQTFPLDDEISGVYLCMNCKAKTQLEVKDVDDSSNLQLVPIDCSESIEKPKTQVPKVRLVASS